MTSYKRDQDRLVSGKKPRNRLEMIRIQMDNPTISASPEDEELHALISAQQSESAALANKKKKKKRKSRKVVITGDEEEEEEDEVYIHHKLFGTFL